MRGKHYDEPSSPTHPRITPAHAGKTGLDSVIIFATKDHPRTCGENREGKTLYPLSFGSPPHMRGKRKYLYRQDAEERITPAHAGKTCPKKSSNITPPDHPRTCGENVRTYRRSDGYGGSPPHMRGKHFGNVILPRLILIRFVNFL